VLDGDGLARSNDGVGLGLGSDFGNVLDLDTGEVGGRAVGGLEGKGVSGELVESTAGLV